MNAERDLLEQQRDQALRDIVDLQRQVDDREIRPDAAHRLREEYERSAAHAFEKLEALPAPETEVQRSPGGVRASGGKIAAYLVAAAIAVFAVLVLLPQYVATRPDGGFVTGNEAVQQGPGSAPSPAPQPPRDLSTVTDAEMEAVLKANPNVVGMRLALATRYVEKGKYEQAAKHYGEALKQDPDNPDTHAQAGWLLFKLDQQDAALKFVNEALTLDPHSQDALWFKANILLTGHRDPKAALEVLERLSGRSDLRAELRPQVQQLMTAARQRPEKGGR